MHYRLFTPGDFETFALARIPVRKPRNAAPLISTADFSIGSDGDLPAVAIATADGLTIIAGTTRYWLSCTFDLALVLLKSLDVSAGFITADYLHALGFIAA